MGLTRIGSVSAGLSEVVNWDFLGLRYQARLAQLAERKALNLVVVGSTPTSGEICFSRSPRQLFRRILQSQHLVKKLFCARPRGGKTVL